MEVIFFGNGGLHIHPYKDRELVQVEAVLAWISKTFKSKRNLITTHKKEMFRPTQESAHEDDDDDSSDEDDSMDHLPLSQLMEKKKPSNQSKRRLVLTVPNAYESVLRNNENTE